MVTLPSMGPSISTPMSRNACKVASASSPSKNPVTRVVPSARAPNIIERCDMDLSPGTRISPCMALALGGVEMVQFWLTGFSCKSVKKSRAALARAKRACIASPLPASTSARNAARPELKASICCNIAERLVVKMSRHMTGSEPAIRVKSRKPPAAYRKISKC